MHQPRYLRTGEEDVREGLKAIQYPIRQVIRVWGQSTSTNTGERGDSKQRRKRVRFANEAFALFPFSAVVDNKLSVFG